MVRKMNKRAYMMTFEAVLAIILSFLFITFIVTSRSPTEIKKQSVNLALILKDNPDFRNCALASNVSCLNSSLELHYPDFTKVFAYDFNITTDPKLPPPELPSKDIFVESLFITGNNTYSYPRVVRLYYWEK